ncbi:MAG: ROK family protein [Gemmataceae bacterium]
MPDAALPKPIPEAPKTLAIDIGGSKVKFLLTGQHEPRRVETGRGFSPQQLVDAIREHTQDWDYERVSIGYPGLVGDSGPRSEPANLSTGWVGFNFAAAFRKPVRILNDASMQALGSYEGGRMQFLGLGTGLGSTLIAENVIVPRELGDIRTQTADAHPHGPVTPPDAPWRLI